MAAPAARPIWMKQAEEAKLKSEAEKAAAAKAAFEATFKDVEKAAAAAKEAASSSDSDDGEESEDLSSKPIGPVDPSKCIAAGTGIAGGTACAPSSFVVTTKDSDGRKVPTGGAQLKVRISPGVGVGGPDQDGMVKDMGDGTYTVTYAVSKRGNYMVHVECNGKPIMGSPFPVFFSASTTTGGLLGVSPSTPYPNLVNQTMPNMPNYSGSVSGAFPGLLGMIPGVVNGASGGVVLPGMGASLGEVCREYLNGRCLKTDCKFTHPPHNLLMTALAATTTMGTLSQAPMAPSAAAMAAAQAIVAAQALQAHAAQMQAQAKSAGDSSGSSDNASKADTLKKTLQVSNLSPLLTVEQLKQLFSYCGTVVEVSITDSKHFAYIEYSKPEEAMAALALNNMDVGGRPLNVEMAKSLPPKPAAGNTSLPSSLPMVMQQAVAMQQMQFQQALLMQQTLASQQAASRAATMKTATELASARAAEISKKLKAEGLVNEENKETGRKSRSPSTTRQRSKSRSRSPVRHRRSRLSRSPSPSKRYSRERRSSSPSKRYARDRRSPSPKHYSRDRRSRSPVRSRHYASHISERRSYRESRDSYSGGGRRERDRSRDHYFSSRRNRSRSSSPRTRRLSRAGSASPKHRRESTSPRTRKSLRTGSRSPKHHSENRSPSRRNTESSSRRSRRSRSKSLEGRNHSDATKDTKKSEKSKSDNGDSDRTYEKSKLDNRKSDKTKETAKESDALTKHSRELREDRATNLSKHKKISTSQEDGTLKKGKELSGHADARLDNSPHRTEASTEEDFNDNNDQGDRKKLANTSEPKPHKSRSESHGERSRPASYERSRAEGSGCTYRKHEKTDSLRDEHTSTDYESSQSRREKKSLDSLKSRSHKRSSKHLDDRSSRDDVVDRDRWEDSKGDCKRGEKVDKLVRDDSREISLKMKTRKRRSPSLENGKSGDREERSKKLEKVDKLEKKNAIKDQDYNDFESRVMEEEVELKQVNSEVEEQRNSEGILMTGVDRTFVDVEEESRENELVCKRLSKADPIDEDQDFTDRVSAEFYCNKPTNFPEPVAYGTSSQLERWPERIEQSRHAEQICEKTYNFHEQDYFDDVSAEMMVDRKDAIDRNRNEISDGKDGEPEKSCPTQEHDYSDCKFTDMKAAHSPNLRAHGSSV